jgi:hypothetical protein
MQAVVWLRQPQRLGWVGAVVAVGRLRQLTKRCKLCVVLGAQAGAAQAPLLVTAGSYVL